MWTYLKTCKKYLPTMSFAYTPKEQFWANVYNWAFAEPPFQGPHYLPPFFALVTDLSLTNLAILKTSSKDFFYASTAELCNDNLLLLKRNLLRSRVERSRKLGLSSFKTPPSLWKEGSLWSQGSNIFKESNILDVSSYLRLYGEPDH